jgi:phosphate-selective porin OprO and OprP
MPRKIHWKKPGIRSTLIPGFIIACIFLINNKAIAQNTDLVDSSETQFLADSGKTYFIPDASHKAMNWTRHNNKFFSLQLGFAPIVDYVLNIQDEDSKTQVGVQESRFDLRSGRVSARGKINFKRPWSYMVSIEYRGLDREEDDPPFGITDLKFVIPIFKKSDLTFGKIKETFSYEMVGDAANLPHQERLLNPFFKSRNTGIVLKHYLMDNRMTLAAGWFNDWFSGGNGTNTFTGRITGLTKWVDNGRQFVHSGIAFRYVQAKTGTVRLKGKNESNLGSYYVDTKNFDALHQFNLGLEQLWSLENFSILFEYIHNWSKTAGGYEQFKGYYVTTSYIFSGEQRPYDMKAAYARRIKPIGRAGAFEIVTRFGRVNLDSRNINGGINTIYTFGFNWWATQYWKAGLFYNISNLAQNEIIGITNTFQWRIQWIF